MMPKHQPRTIEASSGHRPHSPRAVRAQWSVVLLGLREARGVTQDGWAALLGHGRATVQRWEREEAVPTADAVEALVRVCREEGLLRRFERGRLRGMAVTVDLLRELLAEARQRVTASPLLPEDTPTASTPSPISPLPSPSVREWRSLPVRLSSFLGRERELDEIRCLLETTRLLTLTGTGGVGKSSLAIETARSLTDTSPHGVVLVELASLTDPGLVASTVATAFLLREQSNQPVVAALCRFLQSKVILLVLDNCEHLVAACAVLVEQLLRAAPGLRILATSREPLRAEGETVYRVPSLENAPVEQNPMAEDVSRYAATRLFVERARSVRPAFVLDPSNVAAVAQICARLDGIPHALELAAARVGVLSVEQIAARLDDRFRLLTVGTRTALPRQQTLRATIDWSYSLLTRRDRMLLQRLAVFAGGWTLEAAEAVGPGGDVAGGEVLDGLAALVTKSLVVVEEHGGEARYRLLETIRQYAWERLAEAGEATAARQRHLAWFLELAERAELELPGSHEHPGLKQLAVEHDNLRAALAWSLEHDPESHLCLAGCLAEFWRRAGHHAEGRRWLKAALAIPRQSSSDAKARARVLLGAGSLAADAGEFGPGLVSLAEESVQLFRDCEDRRALVMALQHLGRCVLDAGGDVEQVRPLFGESLQAARSLNDGHGIGFALANLAYLAWRQGNHREAREQYKESVAYIRASGDAMFTALVLGVLGWSTLADGDVRSARRYKEESLAILRRLEAREAVGLALLGLAHVARQEGDDARLGAYLEESASFLRETGSPGLSDWLSFVGLILVERSEYTRGARLLAAGESEGPRFGSLRLLLYEMPRDALEAALARARSALGDDAFPAAWDEGKALTPEQAIADASLRKSYENKP